jgi:3-hydroxypropanoate dehydrogenase
MTATDIATPAALGKLDEAGLRLLFTEARTANTFAPTPVTDEELSAIWQLAKWAPTSANTQPLRVLYVQTAEGRARLVPHMSEGNRAKTATAPAVAVLALDNAFHEHMPTLLPFRPEMRDMLEANEQMRTRLSSFNAALQAGYFILSVRAHGLAAGPMGGFDADGVDGEFFADSKWHAILVVNIGHPGESAWFDRLPRLDEAQVVRWA